MSKTLRTIVILGLLAASTLVLAGGSSQAGNKETFHDDCQPGGTYTPSVCDSVHPESWTAGTANPPVVGHSSWGKDPAELGGCDTVDPVFTINSGRVAYRCVASADLLKVEVQGVDTASDADLEPDALRVTFHTRGAIPKVGNPINPSVETFQGLHFDLWFQTEGSIGRSQNGRYQAGQTADCQRYAHYGPYLEENNEWMTVWVDIVQAEVEKGVAWSASHGWSHYDPVALGNFLVVADPRDDLATQCTGPGSRIRNVVPFAGTGRVQGSGLKDTLVSTAPGFPTSLPEYSNGDKAITVQIPFNFSMVDNQKNTYTYQLFTKGMTLKNVSAHSSAVVDTATTPPITNPLTQQQLMGSQGVSNTFLLDWIGWNTYDIGTFTPQTEALYGPTCPYFGWSEYTPGQARQDKSPTYLNLGKGATSGRDNDIQFNPLYPGKDQPVGSLGLSHYDASQASGTTVNDYQAQDHKGALGCDIAVPTSARMKTGGPSVVL